MGVEASVGADELRTAYRNLARRLHPDRYLDAEPAAQALAARRMREVNEAWAVLGDPAARARYDLELRASLRGRSPAGGRGGPAPAVDPDPEEWSEDPDDDEDLVELSRAEAAFLRRGPVVLALVLALVIFIGTAYAGSRAVSNLPNPADPRPSLACVDTPREPCSSMGR